MSEQPPSNAIIPPAGKDLTIAREPRETDEHFMQRWQTYTPDSEQPTDVVPNRPNIKMGGAEPPAPVPVVVQPPEPEQPEEPEPPRREEPRPSARGGGRRP